ncbi:hypothetical protein, partial [Pseudomonas aeruginosa]|uniref:hypothetical protein n=1 Tax=Pseudomonas aeruginosa TaxID=287 RepID=UPI002B40D079
MSGHDKENEPGEHGDQDHPDEPGDMRSSGKVLAKLLGAFRSFRSPLRLTHSDHSKEAVPTENSVHRLKERASAARQFACFLDAHSA